MNKLVLLAGLPILSLLISGSQHANAQVVLDQLIDSDTLSNGRGLACTLGPGGTTRENQYARSYDLSLCPTTDNELLITNVTFGVEVNTIGGYDVDVNIFADESVLPDPPLTTLVLLASTSVTIPVILNSQPDIDRLFIADFSGSPLYIPANTIMVVELFFSDRVGGDGGHILPGFNDLGETDSGYFKSDTCGFTSFDTYESNGWFDNHFIQVVTGDLAELAPAPCPEDCALVDGIVDVNELINLLAGWGASGQPCDIADGDDDVNVNDLIALLAAWGPCAVRQPYCEADIDNNDAIDVGDLVILLADWGLVECTRSDIDFSGLVDVLDLIKILTDWGPCP